MKTLPLRSLVVAVGVLSAIGATVTASTASADTTGPVTGGSTTVSVPLSLFTSSANKTNGFYAVPTSPATVTYDPSTQAFSAAFPVTGGDASVNTFYGTLSHSGGILVGSVRKHKNVQLSNLVFNIEDDSVTATVPALTPGGATSVMMFDALGNHDITPGTPETFSASDLQLDAQGAAYLNSAFAVKVFTAGLHIGSFSTTFTNTNDS